MEDTGGASPTNKAWALCHQELQRLERKALAASNTASAAVAPATATTEIPADAQEAEVEAEGAVSTAAGAPQGTGTPSVLSLADANGYFQLWALLVGDMPFKMLAIRVSAAALLCACEAHEGALFLSYFSRGIFCACLPTVYLGSYQSHFQLWAVLQAVRRSKTPADQSHEMAVAG